MIDALEKRLIEALKSVEAHGNVAPAHVHDDIDFVMCTHLHVDHVGWNARLQDGRWTPTFPKARDQSSKGEFDYWTEQFAKASRGRNIRRLSMLPAFLDEKPYNGERGHSVDLQAAKRKSATSPRATTAESQSTSDALNGVRPHGSAA